MTENLHHLRSSSMNLRIAFSASKKELRVRHQGLTTLCQEGLGVGGFTQLFWTVTVGLKNEDPELIEMFSNCLDYPLLSCEMDELKTLGFWGFIKYLTYQHQLAQSIMMIAMPEYPVSVDVTTELSAITDVTFAFPVIVNGTTEAIKVTARHLRLVSKLEEMSLTLVHAVKSSIRPSESTTEPFPVQESSDSIPESASVRDPLESTQEPAPVQEPKESTPESAPVQEPTESTPESAPIQEPTESTPESAPVQKPTESTPESAPVQKPT